MAAKHVFWEIMIVLWTKSLVGGQSISVQPVSSEGDEGKPDSFTPFVFQVSGMDVGTQIVAIKRRGIIIADETVKRESVFELLGLDADNYVITRQEVLPDRRFTLSLRLTNPNRLDTAWFSFVVCGRNLSDAKCAENDIVLESDIAQLTVRYVPGDVYPNCSSLIKDGVGVTRDGMLRVVLGETVVMLCQSEVGEPPVNLSWERGGHHMASETSSDSVFRYSEVTFVPSLDDEGVAFACNLTRPLTNDVNRSCVVGSFDIVSEPTVTINYRNQNGFVIVGSTVVFTSFASTVTSNINRTFWTVSEELKNATERYRIKGNQFTLRDIEEEDGGSSIMYVVIDNDGIHGVAIVTLQTINADDLPTQPPNHVVSTTRSTKACTTEPTPPADYSAVVIGSLFAALLVFVMVVMVCLWYFREVRPKKQSPAVLRVEKAAKNPNNTAPSHQKTSLAQGVTVACDNDQHPSVRQRDLQVPHEESNATGSSSAHTGNHEPLEFIDIHSEEKHRRRDEDSHTKQGTSSRREISNHVDDGTVDYGPRSQYYKQCNEAHAIEPTENRYQNIDNKNVLYNLYDYNNDAYNDDETKRYPKPDFDRYGVEPDTVRNDEGRSFGRLTPSEMSDVGNNARSQEHASTQNDDWGDTLRYDVNEDEYEGVQTYV